jgi:hypothetical protein
VKYEAYRAAIDEGTSELSEIVGKIEQLRLRETLIERTVEGLKALIDSDTQVASTDKSSSYASVDKIPEPLASPTYTTQQPADPTHYLYEKAVSESKDPLQWRIDSALSDGFANRRRVVT